jgi:thiamine-phosphate pyrophosphorylase
VTTAVRARATFDPALCLVLGPPDTGGRDVVATALAAVAGGATMVQLRWKAAPGRPLAELATALVDALAPSEVPVVVNDRADVAAASGAAGVHVGEDDLSPEAARRIVGPAAIVGVSVATLAAIARVDAAVVDYAGVGPVWATCSKPDAAPPLGAAGLALACTRLAVPVIAIGGIDASRAREARAMGASGVAVVAAIARAADPREAAARLRAACVRDRAS